MLLFLAVNLLCLIVWLEVCESNTLSCTSDLRQFDPYLHKPVYQIAIHAIRGYEATISAYNLTFSEYLTETAGRRFDPPIAFEMKPVTNSELFAAIDRDEVDFFYSNPGAYSCVGVERGAQPLATTVARHEIRGHSYDLDVFGGVIFTRADNDNITSLKDLKNRIIGAGGITMFMAAQAQFTEMTKAGVSPYLDPKQIVFTGNQFDVVGKVLSGEFDVGLVRTDQIERQKDAEGRSINPGLFKTLQPKIHIMEDGSLFPYLHSTDIYPEWPIAALTHIPKDVAREVQDALFALSAHANAGFLFQECKIQDTEDDCAQQLKTFYTRCDTTKELALLAMQASQSGNIAAFRPPRSYFDVVTMLQEAGFIWEDETGDRKCLNSESVYSVIRCPPGHFKLSESDFDMSCGILGLECPEGSQCMCKPCIASFEVEVFEHRDNVMVEEFAIDAGRGCSKMSLCGVVEQRKLITFRLIDRKKRKGARVRAVIHFDEETIELEVEMVEDVPYNYEISWTGNETGVGLLQLEFDGVQIPESPLRLQVEPRECETEFPGQSLVNSDHGECICANDTRRMAGRCIGHGTLWVVSLSVSFLFLLFVGHLVLKFRMRRTDSFWMIDVDEFQFEDPVAVIGEGSFGVVLRADYRGTTVAIKHAVKPKRRRESKSISRSCERLEIEMGTLAPAPVEEIASKGTVDDTMEFLAELSGRKKRKKLFSWYTRRQRPAKSNFNQSILGESFSASRTTNSNCILFPWLDPETRKRAAFIGEMRVLSRLRHPCITTVMGAVVTMGRSPMLVMEYLEYGSLAEGLLQNETIHLNGEIVLQILRNVAQGLRYLHSSRPPILHGDLKGKNILIDSRFRAKLCDFGLSSKKRNSISGTPFWLAPEYLLGNTDYNAECDMYSIGIICYEIYSRKRPYEGEDFCDVLRRVCNNRINKRPTIPESTPPRMVEIMKKCWSPSPNLRPSAKDFDMILMEMQSSDTELLTQGSTTTARSGDMLYEIFPKRIANDLQAGKKVEPESHELVTIIFSDIVGFTDLSRKMSPLKVSNMLDRLYLAFDQISRKYNVFKMETIGDAYMGVTNLDGNQDHNHVKLAAEFAVDLIQEANRIVVDEHSPEKGYINIRVGFHSGPVVSNVIGSLNPRYGLFGDTVNTSNRMESNSECNRVLCSERSWGLLKEQAPGMPTFARGKIDVKGRGSMRVFWVGKDFCQTSQKVGFVEDESEVLSVCTARTPNTTKNRGAF